MKKRWLSVGFELYDQIAGHVRRDYFLPLPTPDLEGVRRAPMKHSDGITMTRRLLYELTDQQGNKLLESALVTYWSEHGDRAQAVTWAACLGKDQTVLNYLGRWRPSISEQYVRTSRSMVMATQEEIAAAVRENFGRKDILHEYDVLTGIELYLKDKGIAQETINQQV